MIFSISSSHTLISSPAYPVNSEAQYFADQTGVYEIVQAKDTSRGKVMRQVWGVECV